MTTKTEQLDRARGRARKGGYRRWVKIYSHRAMRRLGKQFLDMAPKKYFYHGYA